MAGLLSSVSIQGSSLTRLAGPAAGLLFVALLAAVATYLAAYAVPLAVMLIVLALAVLGLCLLVMAPAPSAAVERLAFNILLVYVCTTLAWPRYAGLPLPGLPLLPLGRLALIALLCVVLYLLVGRRQFRDRLLRRIRQFRLVFLPLIALLFWKLIGIPFSDSFGNSARSWLNELVSVYVPTFSALALITSRNDLRRLVGAFMLGACLVLAVAAAELVVGHNIFLKFLKIDSDYLASTLLDKARNGVSRVQATFSHPLTLSEFLTFAIPVAFWWAFERGFRWLRIAGFAGLLALFMLVIIKTGSRSGIGVFVLNIGILTTLLMFRLSRAHKNSPVGGLYALVSVFVICAALTGIYLLQEVFAGRGAAEINSNYGRLVMWNIGMAKALASPLLGYGADMAADVVGFISNGVLTIDSYYLSVLVDGGFPALLLWVLTLTAFIAAGLRNSMNSRRPDMASVALVGGVIGFAVIKSVLSLPHNHGIIMLMMASLLLGSELDGERGAG